MIAAATAHTSTAPADHPFRTCNVEKDPCTYHDYCSNQVETKILFFPNTLPEAFPGVSKASDLFLKIVFHIQFLETCFTPFTVLSFFISVSKRPVSPTIIVIVPENSPS